MLPSSTSSSTAPQAQHTDVLSVPAVVPITTTAISVTDTARLQKSVIATSSPDTQSNHVTPISTTPSTIQVPTGMTCLLYTSDAADE